MTNLQLTELRQEALLKIHTIYRDVTEGRWDNTHTAGQLRAAVAMHAACCQELQASKPSAKAIHDLLKPTIERLYNLDETDVDATFDEVVVVRCQLADLLLMIGGDL